jgi:hypothetical protein
MRNTPNATGVRVQADNVTAICLCPLVVALTESQVPHKELRVPAIAAFSSWRLDQLQTS